MPLLIAGIIQDQAYFREQIEPRLGQTIRYIGPVDVAGKNALFAGARALLHLNTIPERFGLVLAEANAAGVPVIAMDLGSCREVIDDGRTGFGLTRAPRSRDGTETPRGNAIFLPVLVVPAAALVGTLAAREYPGWADPKQATLVCLAIGVLIALAVATLWLRPLVR